MGLLLFSCAEIAEASFIGPVPNSTLHVDLRSCGLTMSIKSTRPWGVPFVILGFLLRPICAFSEPTLE